MLYTTEEAAVSFAVFLNAHLAQAGGSVCAETQTRHSRLGAATETLQPDELLDEEKASTSLKLLLVATA